MPDGMISFADLQNMSQEEFKLLYCANYKSDQERFDRIEKLLASIDNKLEDITRWKISVTTKIIMLSGAVGAIVSIILKIFADKLLM